MLDQTLDKEKPKVEFDDDGLPIPKSIRQSVKFDDDGLPIPQKKNGGLDGSTTLPKPTLQSSSQDVPKKINPYDDVNAIDLANHAVELQNKTIPDEEGEEGDIVNVPDQQSVAESKKVKDYLKTKKINADELANEFSDFPKEAFDHKMYDGTMPNSKENLLALRQKNPVEYLQHINDIKNQYAILKKGGLSAANEYAHTSAANSLPELYGNIRTQQNIIGETLTGEERDKALQRVEENTSHLITPTSPELIEEYKKSGLNSIVDATQYAGLKTLELFHPEEYKQTIDFLKTPVKPLYEHSLPTEATRNIQSPVAINTTYENEQKEGGKLSQKTIDEQIAVEATKRKLANIGRSNALTYLSKKMSDADNEELSDHIKGVATQIEADAKGDDIRYPLTASMKFDEQVKEKTGNAPSMLEYGTLRFAKMVSNMGNSIENLVNNSTSLQRQRLGEKMNWDKELFLPSNLKSKNVFSKATAYQISGFLGDIAGIAFGSAGMPVGGVVKQLLPMYLTAQNDYYSQAVEEGKTNPNEYANLHAGIVTLAAAIAPRFEYVKSVIKNNPKLAYLLDGIDEKTWNTIVEKNTGKISKIKDAILGAGKEGVKQASIWGAGMSVANDAADNLFYNKKIPISDMAEHAYQATKDMFIGQLPLMGLHTITKFRNTHEANKAMIWELGDNKDIQLKRIEDNLNEGTITVQQADQRKEVVNNISKLIDKVPLSNDKGKVLSGKEKSDYLYNLFIGDKAADLKKELPKNQSEKAEHIELVNDFKNDLILQPKTGNQLQSRKNALEKILEPKKDESGKAIELNEKIKKETEAELDAIEEQIKNRDNEKEAAKVLDPKEEAGTTDESVNKVEQPTEEKHSLKNDSDIEKRMLEIESDSSKSDEFNLLEKEMEKRERASVFNVPLENVNDAVNALMKKEKEQPNGFGSFIEKRDARETKEVANKYLNPKEITDSDLKKDFKGALLGNPDTWYADGLKLREAAKESANRGIPIEDLLKEATDIYIKDGYDLKTAKEVVASKLRPIFEGSQKVETDRSKLLQEEKHSSITVIQPQENTKPNIVESNPTEPPPIEGSGNIVVERPDTELSFRGLQNVANEFGYEDVKSRDRVTDIKEQNNADQTINEWKEKGVYNKEVEDLLTKINDRELVPTAKQRLVLQQHLADEVGKLRELKVNSPDFDEQLKKVQRIKEIGQIARQEAGAALRIGNGNGSIPRTEDYADALINEAASLGVTELPNKVKEQVTAEHEQITKLRDELAKATLENERLQKESIAKKEFAKEQRNAPKQKKTHEDYTKERKAAFDSAREALKKLRTGQGGLGVSVPLVRELTAIAPHMGKIVKSLFEEGIDKFSDIVDLIHDELKDDMKGLRRRDVVDLISGDYNKKEDAKINPDADKLADIKRQARLTQKLQDLQNGLPEDFDKSKVEQSPEVKELIVKIKKVKDDLSAMDYLHRGDNALKRRLQKEVSELKSGEPSKLISTDIAKTIGQYVKNVSDKGISKFDDLVNNVFDKVKDIVTGISKSDVIDVMAGKYKGKIPTKNELAVKLREFKKEAELLKKLELERLGKNAKTPKEEIEKSRRITDLENKVKEIRERNKDKTPVEKTDGERLAAKRKFIQKSIDDIQKDIKEGRFEKPERLPEIKLDKKTQALQDRLIELEAQQMIRRQKNEYDKRSTFSKVADTVWQTLGLRRLINSAIDFSILFRQASPVTMNITKYIPRLENGKLRMNTAPRAIADMFNVAFSPDKFKHFQYDLEKSDAGRLFTHFNGVFSNPTEVKMEKREEEFSNNLLARIGQKIENSDSDLLKGTAKVLNKIWFSERAAAGLLNSIRVQEFAKGAEMLMKKGITPENTPKEYTELVKWVMNSTGRGNMLAAIEDSHAARVTANRLYFGARLMAAKINMLNPVYYVKMPKEVRVQALKDMAGYTSTLLLAGIALKASGASISLNPDEPDFLQARFGDKVYDISGGSGAYVRTFLRFSKAIAKQIKSPGSKESNSYSKFAGKSLGKTLFVNKLSPNSAYIWHVAGAMGFPLASKSSTYDESGRMSPFDPYELAKVYPLYVDGTIQAYKKGGIADAMTMLIPDIFGIGTQQYNKNGGTGGGGGASGKYPTYKSQKAKDDYPKPPK